MLHIVNYIKANGLAKAIETFKLKTRVYDKKICLKYDQLESPMDAIEVQECRGLVLERDTWKVLCLSFFKFFNYGETNAAKIDLDTAIVQYKADGTLIQCYYDPHKEKWFAATTGTAEGEGEVNNKRGTTFNELFWETINRYSGFKVSQLLKENTYVFELCTPYNVVVTPHTVSTVTLLTIRDNNTLEEYSYDIVKWTGDNVFHVPVIDVVKMNQVNFNDIIETFKDMPWSEEGYVVVDENFNRVKIKNPAYVAIHHTKNKLGEHHILEIIKTNEIEEYMSVFTERRDEILSLELAYKNFISRLDACWFELKNLLPKNITKEEQKLFAMNVFKICDKHKLKEFTGLFFCLKDGKINSVVEYVRNLDNKKLWDYLVKK